MERVAITGVRRSTPPRMGGGALVALALVALAAGVIVLAAALVAAAVWFAVRHPFLVAAGAATALAGSAGGPGAVLALWVLGAAAVASLRSADRRRFDRWVLGRWRHTFVYRWRWRRVMASCGLSRPGRWRAAVPALAAVRSSRWIDVVDVHPLPGQDEATFGAGARPLARALGVLDCRPVGSESGAVRLELRRGDPLGGATPPVVIAPRRPPDALAPAPREPASWRPVPAGTAETAARAMP